MQKNILRVSGFAVYLCVVFLNAFVDLGHKIIIQNTIFKLYDNQEQIILSAIVNGLILLPFILLFTPSGYVADKYPKNKTMRLAAWGAVFITLTITLCYYMGWFWFAFGLTFVLAMQSAFYSPAKYGFIKELVGENLLTRGNGAVQATTMISILLGIFFFSILFELILSGKELTSPADTLQHIAPLGWALVAFSLIELFMAYRIPQTKTTDDTVRFDWHRYVRLQITQDNIRYVFNNKILWLSIIGLSVFWSISQVILAAYPAFAKAHLGMTNAAVVQGYMACAGIGIMIGSLISGRLSANHIETGLIPIGAAGITLAVLGVNFWESAIMQAVNFLLLGIMGGFFVIPLNALLQYNAGDKNLGRVIATNNLIQNIAMLSFLALTALLAMYSIDSIALMYLMAVVALIGTGYTIFKLPQSLIRFVLSRAFLMLYNVKVIGFKHIPPDKGVLLLGNHISWIDWALVQLASPRSLHFVIERSFYQRWYLTWLLKLFGAIPISKGNYEASLKTINQLLQEGKAVCLFPEGTISRNGQLSTFKHGYEKAIAKTDAVIVPFYLHGLWGSAFSRSTKREKEPDKQLTKRDIIVAFGSAISGDTKADVLKQRVFDLSVSAWQEYANALEPIPNLWIDNAKSISNQSLTIADSDGTTLNPSRFMTAVFCFAKRIKQHSKDEQNIGLLLPSSIGGAIANMAVLTLGKTVVNLNYTASKESVRAGIAKAGIKNIYTSKLFKKKLLQRGIDFDELLTGCGVHYLEDIKQEISQTNQILTLISVKLLPASLLKQSYVANINTQDTAAILFSSGSEGTPKGIKLSHVNLSANIKQALDVINPPPDEVIMSSLPTFHAFGLLVTTYLPLTEGIPVVCHPDPTDGLGIAKTIAEYKATLLVSTSTFLKLYNRNRHIHPLMLSSLRLAVAGAEKLNSSVKDDFKLKFSKDIYEGYGATEASPVVSVNTPDYLDVRYWNAQINTKVGTVGLPIPGTSIRIVDPETYKNLPIGDEGLVLISGPQIMQGYLDDDEKTEQALVELDGQRWYKSGDKGKIDSDGFLTIVDRYSRFGKIGGEMVSLSAIEEDIKDILNKPDMDLLAIALPDERKGEKIVLLIAEETEHTNLRKQLTEGRMNPLMIPSSFQYVKELPRLGNGKIDIIKAKALLDL